MRIRDEERRLLAQVTRSCSRLYTIRLNIACPVCLVARGVDDAWLWHQRYGHIGFQALRKLVNGDMVRGLPWIDHVDQLCDSCLAGKQRRNSFPEQARRRAAGVLDLVHGDICGPISPPTPSGNRYFLLLVDDLSRFMWLNLLTNKEKAPAAIKKFKAAAEVETGRQLKILHTDRGGEFTSVEFGMYCAEEGVQRQLTAPYSPQQNGVVERRNQTVVGMARNMMKGKGLPGMFWGEAVSTAVFILNRSLTRSLEGKTPFEAWYGKRPAVSFLRTFGCIAHVRDTRPHLKKLEDRSHPMIFVRYEAGSKAYRVFNPVDGHVHVTRDAIFDEAAQWRWSADSGGEQNTSGIDVDTFTVEFPATGGEPERGSPAVVAAPPTMPSPTSLGGAPVTPVPVTPVEQAQGMEFATPPSSYDDMVDVKHDEEVPVRFRTIDNLLGPGTPPGLATRVFNNPVFKGGELMFTSAEESTSFREAEKRDCWRRAMKEEMNSIEENKTWSLTELPLEHTPIGLKWVFKVKRDA